MSSSKMNWDYKIRTQILQLVVQEIELAILEGKYATSIIVYFKLYILKFFLFEL